MYPSIYRDKSEFMKDQLIKTNKINVKIFPLMNNMKQEELTDIAYFAESFIDNMLEYSDLEIFFYKKTKIIKKIDEAHLFNEI